MSQQSDERAENEARTRAQLDEQLKASLQNASDLQVELQVPLTQKNIHCGVISPDKPIRFTAIKMFL